MFLSAFLLLALTAASLAETDYDKIFAEDIDVDSIITNDRILDTYLNCFYSTGPCSSLAETVKGKITEVFSTVCGECTPKMKKMLHHTLNLFIKTRPADWEKILEIYDPEKEYRGQMTDFYKGPEPEA